MWYFVIDNYKRNMMSYFKYITRNRARTVDTAAPILRYFEGGNFQWGHDFSKLYLYVIEKRVRKESALTRYRRKFALFPRWWVQKILVWQIRSPRQHQKLFKQKLGPSI
jgi:hypothetical protein